MRRLSFTLAFLTIAAAMLSASATFAFAAYTPPTYKVAVVYSQSSQDWVDQYNRGYGILYKEQKVMEYLQGRGWDVQWIYDKDLESISKLRQYDVVVATYVFAMSPTAAKTVNQYVAEGGGLVTLFASPRVAPGVGGSERDDHWVYIMNHQGWEWGPLSEAYQTYFIDDVGALKFVNRPAWGDPIVSGVASILTARGLDDGDLSLYRNQSPGAWIEYVRRLSGNSNTAQFMNLSQLTAPNASTNYSISNGAGGVRSTYLNGRTVYFYHSIADYVFNQDGSGNQTVSTGVKQSEIAGAYIESAIVWAGGSGGRPGVLVRDGRTYATLNVYQDGIYASQYVINPGNVNVTGTLYFRVYDPSGKLVKSSVRYKIGVEPGATQKYSESYVVGKLAAGVYLVEIEYVTTYPAYERRYVEYASVYRGQGTGIRTNRNTAKTAGQVVYDPRVVRSAGSDRYNTSLAIADAAGGYPRPGGYVVIAGGGGPDALVASGIAGVFDAPLILTSQANLPVATDAWLRDRAKGFDKAVIVGGEVAVSAAVEQRLKDIFGNGDVERLAGPDRYATSAAVAEEMKEELGTAYDGGMIVTNGRALADAAGASAVAYGRKWPIVYVRDDHVPDEISEVVSEITSGTAGPQAWIAGGTAVVQPGVEAELASLGLSVKRAAGADRYETAAKLSDLASSTGSKWTLIGMASGVKLADALCLGSYVGRADGVMLLTNGSSMTTPTQNRIKDHKSLIQRVSVGGGTAVVTHDLCAAITNLLP